MIYHITSRSAWNQARARGMYRTESLDTEGFIHCSTPQQVTHLRALFRRHGGDLGRTRTNMTPEKGFGGWNGGERS